jgi:alpha-tubulin suppressor-like RCC1 family protein
MSPPPAGSPDAEVPDTPPRPRRPDETLDDLGASLEDIGVPNLPLRRVPVPERLGRLDAQTFDGRCFWRRGGPLGCLSEEEPPQLVPMASLECVTDAASAGTHACAYTCDGEVRCWGSNTAGQLGVARREADAHSFELEGIDGLVAADERTCTLDANGGIACWGQHEVLGPDAPGQIHAAPLALRLPAPARSVSLGSSDGCAVLDDATVACWGKNRYGQSRPGRTGPVSTPTRVAGLHDITQVSVGDWHACARSATSVRCWGHNHLGQLGIGHTNETEELEEVPLPGRPVDLEVGNARACAALASGRVYCWGYWRTDGGHLTRPARVETIEDGVQVAVADDTACVRRRSGTVSCWDDLREAPRDVVAGGADAVVAQRGSVYEGFCALVRGRPRCFGFDDEQLSAAIETLAGVSALALGERHACAATSAGVIRCVGNNRLGQLGTGELLRAREPVSMPLRR